jgi:3-hydroxyisobutyrate dehydrogenase-like beta-hydroxyacid dehydrogenase
MLAAVTTEVIAHLAFCAGWPSAMWAARASLHDADRKSENRSDGEAMSKGNVVVGFVGLGTMGGRMAANVQRAGFKLVVHDLHRQSASHHLAAGAIWADSPRALAIEADVIFSSLPEPSDVEAVALGGDGLIAGIKPGAAYFDLSTNSPSVVKKLNATFAEKGAHMLDAPVSGGPAGAASRKLAIWVGGDENVFNRHKAVLDAIGDKAAYIGPIGSATVAKLVHNMSGYALVCALAETFTMGVKAGVEPLALWQAVRQGAAGRRFTFDALIDQFLPGKYDPPAFALKLAHKDVSLANALGRELGVPMRMCNLTLAEMTEALARGWGGRDSRSVMLLQQERAGVKIAVDPERLREALAPANRLNKKGNASRRRNRRKAAGTS